MITTYSIVFAAFFVLSIMYFFLTPKGNLVAKRQRAAIVLLSFVWPALVIFVYAEMTYSTCLDAKSFFLS